MAIKIDKNELIIAAGLAQRSMHISTWCDREIVFTRTQRTLVDSVRKARCDLLAAKAHRTMPANGECGETRKRQDPFRMK